MPIPPTGLPIEASLGEVLDALASNGSVVVSAEPGAGKTTVIPLHVVEAPWIGGGRVIVLEPRRIAARAAARRMAALRGDAVGGVVGFRTRDETVVSAATRIEVVTEGVLTRMLQHDRRLPGVAAVVFDEFHERSLPGDLGLALAMEARRTVRPDLRIAVLSATLDTARVAAHLGDAPVVVSPGRTHPLTIRWAPMTKDARLEDAVAATVARACREEQGDILVFLPGAAEIRRAERRIDELGLPEPLDVRPLFGGLPVAAQDAALEPRHRAGARRVILATDIAESSLTVEGVRIVIDAGRARVPRHDPATAVTRLVTVAASKASTEQRAGRAGRTEPGVAYRLWSKVEQASRSAHAVPEVLQVDVAGLVLEAAAWGSALDDLPLLDRPKRRSVDDATRLLRLLDAVDERKHVTPTGARLVDLPLHPRLAHLVEAATDDERWTACVIAALVEERDVFTGRPSDRPADLDVRLRLVDDDPIDHPSVDRRAVDRVRDAARDLARRVGADPGPLLLERAADLLALAYPDRTGARQGSRRGRFRLPGGVIAFVGDGDLLSSADEVVVADLTVRGKEGRILRAAGRWLAAPMFGSTSQD